MHEIDARLLAHGSSRAHEVVRLVDLCFQARRLPPLRHDAYLSEHTRSKDGGTLTIYAPKGWWARVDARSRRYGESVSESVRALLHGGLLLDPGRVPAQESLDRVLAAMGDLSGRPAELGVVVWGVRPAFGGCTGAYAATRALERLRIDGRVEKADDGTWKAL
jgi:hypothetical protein